MPVLHPGWNVAVAVVRSLSFGYRPVRLRGDAPTSLDVEHWFEVEQGTASATWRTRTRGYSYALDDAAGHEILAYHWHPEGPSHVTTPHLHLGAGAGALRPHLTNAHLPTGPVTLPAVLRLAVRDLGVQPLRPDWAEVLDRADGAIAHG